MATRNQEQNTTPNKRNESNQAQSSSSSVPHNRSQSGVSERGETDARFNTGGDRPQDSQDVSSSNRYLDQERDLPTSREQGQRSTSMLRSQGAFIPSLFGTPPGLLASAFMTNPFEFMRRITDEMNTLFDTTSWNRTLQPQGVSRRTDLSRLSWMPQIEATRRGNTFVVRADIPGVPKEDLDVRIENDVLIVSGERRQEQEQSQEGGYRSERSYGAFYRTIPLPEDVSEDQISATYRDGVLEVTIPLPDQPEQSRGRRIDIR